MVRRNDEKSNNPEQVRKTCTNTQYVKVTMGMCHNIILPRFKAENSRPTYYLSPANIYGLGIHYDSYKISFVYIWTEF